MPAIASPKGAAISLLSKEKRDCFGKHPPRKDDLTLFLDRIHKQIIMGIKIRIILFALGLLVCAYGFIFAEENPDVLTLDRCFSLAAKVSDDLMIQGERQAQARQRVKEYKGNILPAVGYNFVKTDMDSAGGRYPVDYNDSYFSVNQPLFYGLRDFQAYRQAKNQVTTEGYVYENVERDLRSQTANAFYSLVLVNADIDNLRSSEKILENRITELTERVRLGKSRDSEILMVQSQIAGLKAQEESDNGLRANAVEDLAFLTGLQPSSISVKDDMPAVNSLEPIEVYLNSGKRRSDIEAAESDVVSEKYSLDIANGARLPTLNLLAYWYTHRDTAYPGSNWDTFITLNFPLFQGGSLNAKIVEETSRLKEYDHRLSLVTRQTISEIRKLYQQAISSIKQSVAYQDAYDKAAKSCKMQLQDYRYGLVSNLAALESISSMLDAKRNLDRALIQAKVDKILLEIAASKQ
jgi:outer membrane protein TolC